MKRFLRQNALMLVFFVSSLVVLVLGIAASRMMYESSRMIEDSTRRQMIALSEAASLLATADELDEYVVAGDMDKPGYGELKDKLDDFTRSADIMFTYYLRLDPQTNMMQFVIDNVQEPDEMDGLLSEQVEREEGPDIALTGQAFGVELGNYSQGWDGLMTAYAPVYYSDGRLSNIVAGVDMQDVNIKAASENMTVMGVVFVLALVAVLASCLLCLTLYRRKVRQAEIASEAKSSFLSRMSHEMRTPMNAIMGLCGMAMSETDTGTIRQHLGNIDVSAQHLRQVIDDVLDISKIESGKMGLEFIAVDLRDELDTVCRIIRPQTDAAGQTFTLRVAADVPNYVYYDTTHVRQILVNLLSNAVKFTPGGGSISLSVALKAVQGGRCNLEWCVKDTGIGIGEEAKERLFQPFEQGDVSTTRKYGGTGLGLSISRQLVEMMDGSIRVESAPGQGSEFIFDLWLRMARESEVADAAAVNAEEFDLTGKRILLVEDSDINQMIAVDLLSGFGAEVDTADNGQLGVDAYLTQPERYDLILMDIQMPVMDGYEAAALIRASDVVNALDIPIVAMTANVFKEDVDHAFAAGMNGHVGKPFDVEQIARVLGGLLMQP